MDCYQKGFRFSVLLLIAVAIFSSCDKSEDNNSFDFQNGIVVYMPPPDNCNAYIIKTDDNFMYKPLDLGSNFMIDSLLVRFAFDSTDNFHNCGFGGSIPVIKLTAIEMR